MKRFFLLTTAACLTAALSAGTVNYTADDVRIFPNPERGFIAEFDHVVTEDNPYCVKGNEEYLRQQFIEKDSISLILVLYYLDKFKSTSILPNAVFNGFETDMQVLREMGMKAILRFAYTQDDNGGTTGYDATLEIAKSHIEQYKNHWQANADVIFCFQAGFVGTWGEWYYTENFDNKSNRMTDKRRALVDALLEAVPADRCIQLRTPLFKTDYVGDTKALTASEAYTVTPKARLGHHNDAFLYGAENMGTYADTAIQKPYLAQETLYVPIGGETNIEDEDLAAEYASKEKTTAEMSRLHWTFIQSGYAPQTTDMWRKNGTFDELNRKMGYRYQLVSGTYSDEVEQGGKLSVKMQIRNAGYAPLYNERHAYIVLRNEEYADTLMLQTDPRTWLPNGVITTIEETVDIPDGVAAGEYRLYLYLPDLYESLADDPRYAVRFANEDVWERGTGMNKLDAAVSVVAKHITPDPDPDPEPGEPVVLPATLNKANFNEYSDDMTWYNTDYFDFGPNDAENINRWADWEVELRYPGKYNVSATGYYPNGHQWQIELQNSGADAYSLPASWEAGEQTENGEAAWDLSAVPAGTYTLRVMNIMAWGQPKLKSITLEYDGNVPTGENVLHASPDDEDMFSGQAYDLLGRPVDASYRGVVILNGKKMQYR